MNKVKWPNYDIEVETHIMLMRRHLHFLASALVQALVLALELARQVLEFDVVDSEWYMLQCPRWLWIKEHKSQCNDGHHDNLIQELVSLHVVLLVGYPMPLVLDFLHGSTFPIVICQPLFLIHLLNRKLWMRNLSESWGFYYDWMIMSASSIKHCVLNWMKPDPSKLLVCDC